jgi:hypothetical protein
MFHVGMWRERFRDAFQNVKDGKDYQRPPAETNELNDAELPTGIGTPLADAASRADHLLGEIMDLYESIGERPFEWYLAKTTTEAVLRNSYMHPRLHMFEYFRENGLDDKGSRLFVDAAEEMRSADAPALIMGAVLYNLAGVRSREGKQDEALELLKQALPLRPDLTKAAQTDSDLVALREDPRFQELVKSEA